MRAPRRPASRVPGLGEWNVGARKLSVCTAMRAAAGESSSGQSRLAFVTKCSGKDRTTFASRTDQLGAARARPLSLQLTATERLHMIAPIRKDTATTKEGWYKSRVHGPFPVVGLNRAKMCLVSICSLLNASQPDKRQIAVAALVDEDTEPSVVQGYARMGVDVIDQSAAAFPPYFNNQSISKDEAFLKGRLAPLRHKATVGEAVYLGYPHFSASPDSWYKLWLWNLTEYSKIFYFDPDTLTQHNATKAYLERYRPFASLMALNQRPAYLNAGMMVLKPDKLVFKRMFTAWMAGNYTYNAAMRNRDTSHGDDDQMFLSEFLVDNHIPMHPFQRCSNDKRGTGHCNPDEVPMFHKIPIWEQARVEALWTAAQKGTCRGNPFLLNWQPPSHSKGLAPGVQMHHILT